MGLLDRLRNKKPAMDEKSVAERLRQQRLPSSGDIQSADEKQTIREHMESELSAQRERRDQAASNKP